LLPPIFWGDGDGMWEAQGFEDLPSLVHGRRRNYQIKRFSAEEVENPLNF